MAFEGYSSDYEYAQGLYSALKRLARERVAKDINKRAAGNKGCLVWRGLILSSITSDAVKYATREWRKYYSENTHMGFSESWDSIVRTFCGDPSFYDLAIWQEIDGKKVLQGLAVGRVSRGKNNVTIHWVERSYAPTYFRGGILTPVLSCAEEYARLLDCKQVFIKDSVDDPKYERYGYRPQKRPHLSGRYLGKELSQ